MRATPKTGRHTAEHELQWLRRFGATVRARRAARRWTQRELGGRVGASQPTVCNIEQGAKWPSGPILLRIAQVLDIPLTLDEPPQ